ncbi:MAG: polymerase beta subunit [Pseudomonadota bacterium]|jgi:DNA polymerase-3 subunit beta
MKITITKSILENMVSSLQPFVEKKDGSQIISHILISAQNDELTMRATDHEIGLSISTSEFEVVTVGQVTANAKRLLDIIRTLKDDSVTVETQGNDLYIKQNRSRYKLPSFNAEEFPKFLVFDHLPKINIDSTKLISGFKKILPAIDANNPKFELNGALIDVKGGGVNLVSTDTKRLALYQIGETNQEELALIVPRKAIQEIVRLFSDNVSIFYNATYLVIQSKNQLFFTKLINGKFPDYHRIMPKEFKLSFNLPKDAMIDSIRKINVLANELRLTFLRDKIVFESLSEENVEGTTELEYSSESEFVIAFSSKYLLDYLAHIDTPDFTFNCNETTTPFEVKSKDFQTIIMPIAL